MISCSMLDLPFKECSILMVGQVLNKSLGFLPNGWIPNYSGVGSNDYVLIGSPCMSVV